MSEQLEAIRSVLAESLERAAQSDDRETAGKVRDYGRRFIFLMNGLFKTGHLYDSENAAFEAPSQECAQLLGLLLEILGTLHVILVEDQVYMNDVRLRINDREQPTVDAVVRELARHNVGGISFHQQFTPADFKQLAMLVTGNPTPPRPREALSTALKAMGDIDLMGIHRFRVGGRPSQKQISYDQAIERSESVVREAMQMMAARRVPNPLPIRKAVIELVGSLKSDPTEGLDAPINLPISAVGERHLLSVSTLAIVLGQRAGLSDAVLSDLGVAAMLHDVGYTHGAYYTGHEAVGAYQLLRQRGFHEAKIRRLLAVLNHHAPYSPRVKKGTTNPLARKPPSLFARILHIVDDYDVLTAPRPGYRSPRSPATVLELMWGARGDLYDPDLLAMFVQCMGRFPPGTLLQLPDGRWAVSVSGARDQERFAWPLVRVVQDAHGRPTESLEPLDLYEYRYVMAGLTVIEPEGGAGKPM